jgi:hypothetical protein
MSLPLKWEKPEKFMEKIIDQISNLLSQRRKWTRVSQTAWMMAQQTIEKWERLITSNHKFLLIKMMMSDIKEKEIMRKKEPDFNLRQMPDGMLKQDIKNLTILVKLIHIEEDKTNLDLKSLNKLITPSMLL